MRRRYDPTHRSWARRLCDLIVPSFVLLLAVGCPQPVVPPPPPVDRPSKEVETLIQDCLEQWGRAHALVQRGPEFTSHMQAAIEKARQADAQGGGRNGLSKTVLGKLVLEANGADGVEEALRLATAAAAEDKGFAPAFLLRAELHLTRRQSDMTIEALAQAKKDLEDAQRAICWLEHGGRMDDPLPPQDDFYSNLLTPPLEMLERLRVIDRYLAFDLGNKAAVPIDAVTAAGGGGHSNDASIAAQGVDVIGKLKARHRLGTLAFDLARFDFEKQPVTPVLLAQYKKNLDDLLGKLDPNCFEAKLELLKVQLRLATELPTRTDDSFLAAYDIARSMIENNGPMVRNDPRVRFACFSAICGYAEFRVSRFVELNDVATEIATKRSLYESVENLTAEFIGTPGKRIAQDPGLLFDLIAVRVGYDLATLRFYAPFAGKDAAAKREFERNRVACEQWLLALEELAVELPPAAESAADERLHRLRVRRDEVISNPKEGTR